MMKSRDLPLAGAYRFGPLVIEVGIESNHPGYRTWGAWFWKIGSTQRFWGSFMLEKGWWFGPMAPYVVARTVVADLELVLNRVRIKSNSRRPRFPQSQIPDEYTSRLDSLGRTLDIYDQVPPIWKDANRDDEKVTDVSPADSLHNAWAMIFKYMLPDVVVVTKHGDGQHKVIAGWPVLKENADFDHFGFGPSKAWIDFKYTVDFFRILGAKMSEKDLLAMDMGISRHGPKEWTPKPKKIIFERGLDYGTVDVQPGDEAVS